jgi:ADP-heptose:LPS heptosyltransferase
LDKFEEIARYLKKKGKKVVLIGSVFEKEYVDTLISRTSDLNGIYSFAGKTNLPQLSYLIRRSELLITNDSGPLHLGVVAGIKTISFFGPETPSKYGPRGKNHIVIYHKTVCSPCMEVFNSKKINCEHNIKCLKGIKIQEIKNAIDRQLK